ncbi:MAG: hypothetical protein DMF59_00925 [Acidobacteria bacterium]|nr:MAG: hypothetical protein DMF59_00925 [Acidobacteriota bacterium]
MRTLTVAVLISLLAFSGFPQQKLVETIEVRVVNVDVVVRDRHGNPVSGLTKDDFEVYEEGVKQTITNLYEVRRTDIAGAQSADASPPDVPLELRQRRLLLFVDSASLQNAKKEAVLAAVERFVDQKMRPEDQAMVVCWRLGLHVILPFSSDKEDVKRAIGKLRHMAPAGDGQQVAIEAAKRDIQYLVRLGEDNFLPWQELYTRAQMDIDGYAQRLSVEQEPMLQAMERMATSIGGLEGKKVLLFVGEHLTGRPGAELYRYAFDAFSPYMGQANLPNLQAITGVSGNRTLDMIDDVAKRASENGVVIYAIGTAQSAHEVSADNNAPLDYTESFSRAASTGSALKAMAGATGGVAVTQTTNFDLAFDIISKDLDSYYSLGYRPPESRGTPRKITVKLKNPAYLVRARETVMIKSSDDQMSDRVIANLYTDGASSAWPISIRTGPPANENGKFKVPVKVTMASTITLLPQDQKLVGGFILYFVIGTGDGRTSEVIRRPQGLGIPPFAEQAVRAKPMTFTTAIRVNPGENILSVGIIDQISGTTGFARAKFVAR